MDVPFQKKLIAISLRVAEESRDTLRDIFLAQAARCEAELKEYEASQPKPQVECKHPGSSLREREDKTWCCTICWEDFSPSQIIRSKWYGYSRVRKRPFKSRTPKKKKKQ